ncbi:RDD family protein [Rhodanobacter sp. DHG33]|uniref:RDD family protein n=1 Tax=Rhodanobacter sp. DHG33 TaxID=2775921 RepID=UPI0017804619|nr:RDD family protein [Rhodanobacter sp. DHG33]MBD8898215.1 RDD family protein [Rhodanobacter sp. DHG33]
MSTETTWYYADRNGQQQGPVSREEFLHIIGRERLSPDTLVWREGLAQWQPLSSLADELGLGQPTAPPPPPPAVPPPRFSTPAPFAAASADVVYAGFVRRAAAYLLDGLILGVINFVLIFVLALMVGLSSLAHAGNPDPSHALWILLVYPIGFGVALLYYSLQESSVHQATLGKRALGIKVTDLEGRRISWKHAIGRWFAAALSHLTLDIGFLMAAFTERKQALHDMVASTLVTDRWAFTDHPERQNRQSSGCLILLVVGVFLIVPVIAILAAIAIPSYQNYLQRAEVVNAIAQAEPLKAQVVEAWQTSGKCPVNGEAGIRDADSYASKQLQSITVGSMKDGGSCALELTLHAPNQSMLDGKRIWLTMDKDSGVAPTWRCSSEVADRSLPMNCREPSQR